MGTVIRQFGLLIYGQVGNDSSDVFRSMYVQEQLNPSVPIEQGTVNGSSLYTAGIDNFVSVTAASVLLLAHPQLRGRSPTVGEISNQ